MKKSTDLQPIFIYGQFRTRTTWWFTQFRKQKQCMCFYTPLTPILVDYTPKEASKMLVGSKCLRHEETHDYYAEYPEYPNKMVKTAKDWTTHPYIMTTSSRDPDMEKHFSYLIKYAQSKGKIPVFKLNWGMLRGSWIRKKFGGKHIFLDRDPPSIRRSFDSFRGSLGWAWRDIVMIIGQNQDHPSMKPLVKKLKLQQPRGLNYEQARSYSNKFCRSGALDQDTKLIIIQHFQKLGRQEAKKYADYVIGDITNVKKTERDIKKITGLDIDLSSYQHKEPAKVSDIVHVSDKKALKIKETAAKTAKTAKTAKNAKTAKKTSVKPVAKKTASKTAKTAKTAKTVKPAKTAKTAKLIARKTSTKKKVL